MLRMKLENWMCHARLELDFSTPVNLIVSQNMQGKTAIRDAIEFAVAGTGLLRGIGTKKDLALDSIYEDEPECSVELLLGGGERGAIHIKRNMDRKGAQALGVGTLQGVASYAKVGEGQSKIWELLAMTDAQLRAMLAADFMFALTPGDRRLLVGSVLGEQAVDSAEVIDQLMRRDISGADAEEFAGIVTSTGWRTALETAERRRADAKAVIKSMGTKPTPAPVATFSWRDEPVDFRTFTVVDIENRLSILRQTWAKNQARGARDAGAIEQRLKELEARQAKIRSELLELQPEVPVDVGEYEKAVRLASNSLKVESSALTALEKEVDRLGPLSKFAEGTEVAKPDVCPAIVGGPRCPMTKTKIAAHRKRLADDAAENYAKLQQARARLETIDERAKQCQAKVGVARVALEAEIERRDGIAEANATLSGVETDIERVSAELADVQSRETPATDGDFTAKRIDQGEKLLAAKHAYEGEVSRTETFDQRLVMNEGDRDRYDRIAQALMPDQVPAVFTDRLLMPMREAIEQFGKAFGGMRLDQEFNVEWLWKGRWRRYRQLSESGRLRIGYAVQYAFAHLAGFPLLVLDQVDHLDAEGKWVLLETLRDLSPEFACVVGLATSAVPTVTAAPFENTETWYLDDGSVGRVR
jgi:hypothetical protein